MPLVRRDVLVGILLKLLRQRSALPSGFAASIVLPSLEPEDVSGDIPIRDRRLAVLKQIPEQVNTFLCASEERRFSDALNDGALLTLD